jgi:hypothetical protein
MSLLNDILGQAKKQIKNNTQSVPKNVRTSTVNSNNTAKRDVSQAVNRSIDSTLGSTTRGINKTVTGGLKNLNGALYDILRGDVSGGVNKIISTPDQVMGNLGKVFGPITSGSILRSPGFFGGLDGPNINLGSPLTEGNALAGALARSDPQMSFNWYAVMPVILPLNGAAEGLPWYYVEEATTPFRNFDTRAIFRAGRNKHYVGTVYSVDSLRLSIYQDSTNRALRYLQAWNNAILQNTSSQNAEFNGGAWGRPSAYKKPILIYLMNSARNVIAELEYTECWPQTIDAYSLNSGSSDRVVNHVTFSVGDVYVNLYNVSNSSLFNPIESLSPGEEFL